MRKCIGLTSIRHDAASFRATTLSLHRVVKHGARGYATTTPDQRRRVAVLGGGITGLATAFYLRRMLPHVGVTLYEANESLGGWLRSTRVSTSDGSIVFEAGPRSLRPTAQGVLTARLISDLKLEDQVIYTPKTSAAASHRYLYYPDHLVRMPHPSFGLFSNLRTIWKEPIFNGLALPIMQEVGLGARKADVEDESLAAFFSRRFTPALVDNILSGVIHGIYAGDTDQLSARSLFPRQWHEDSGRSLTPGAPSMILSAIAYSRAGVPMRADEAEFAKEMAQSLRDDPIGDAMAQCSVFTFKDGMGTLVDALARELWSDDNVEIRTSTKVADIKYEREHDSITIQGSVPGQQDTYSHVISTLSAAHLSTLCPSEEDPLPKIPAVTVMTVNLFYNKEQFLPPGPTSDEMGFGYLLPRAVPFEQNPERALGVVFDHAYSPPATAAKRKADQNYLAQDDLPSGGTKVTVMLGGHWWNGWPDFPDEQEGLAMAKAVLARHLGITAEPELWRVNMQRDCIPQYNVGHKDRLRKIRDVLQTNFRGKLRVAGNWIAGVGVNDCVRSGWEASRAVKNGKDGTGLECVDGDWVILMNAPRR